MQSKKKILIYILAIIFLIFSMKFFERNQMMTGSCSSAYLSGAANWSLNSSWHVDNNEMEIFEQLSDAEKIDYRFKESNKTTPYSYNAIGLLHITALARTIFFWEGELQSLISLQQVVHFFLSFLILLLLKTNYQKIFFYFLYMVNPIVLYFVDFPYYYFWQVIPSAIFIIYLLNNKLIKNKIFIIAIIFSVILIVRPSTLFLLVLVLGYIGYKEGKVRALLAMILFLVMSYFLKPSAAYEPWHTMYVGIGAYSNKYNIEMKDRNGFNAFERETGIHIDSGCKQNAYSQQYWNFIKVKYFDILEKSPLLLIKNGLLNIFESYGFGYKVGMSNVNYLSAFIGLLLMGLLLYYKEYLLFFIIGFASGSFTPYFPPIVAYMFGSYLLIIFSWIIVGGKFGKQFIQKEKNYA